MLWLYRLFFLPLALLAAPYYGWRMRRRGGYGAHFRQRFGATPNLPAKRRGVRRIWLQAVSVGELLAVAPLLEAWRQDTTIEIYLTTTTSTGFALAQARFLAKGLVVRLGYFPLDFWACSARAWRAVDPDLVLLMEGERWPEHINQAAQRGVPVVVVNARLSDRSFARMRRLGPWTRLLVGGLTRVLAASPGDAERFARFCVPAERITVIGNLKFDVALPEVSPADQTRWRSELGLGNAPVLLGASTWPGEEAALLAAWREVAPEGWKLLLVPRHAERRAEVEALLTASGVRFHLRSRGAAPGAVDVAVADTTGELARLLSLAEIVFVGKTLPPHTEGQTPVEAAAWGKALIVGPGTANFRAIARDLKIAGGVIQVIDEKALAAEVRGLAFDPARRAALGAAGARWLADSRGAAARTRVELALILSHVK